MLSTFSTRMELAIEVLFEIHDQYPIIYQVTLLKKLTENENDTWYAPDGSLHTGKKYLRRDLTDFMSESQIQTLVAEIAQHRLEEFADNQEDIAQERALERYMQFPAYFEGPMHYPGLAIT